MHRKIPFVTELIVLIATTFLALFYSYSPLVQFDLQVMGLLVIAFFVVRRFLANSRFFYLFEAMLFVFVTLATVFSTGGVSSPFFFLLYFLLFALVIVLDAASSIILTLLLVVILLTTQNVSGVKDVIPVLSLPFVVPFAQYLEHLQKKAKARERIERRLDDEKEQTLLFLTTVLYRHVQDISARIDSFKGDGDLQYIREKIQKLEELVHKFVHYVEKI